MITIGMLFKLIGLLLIAAGIALACKPEWLSSRPVPTDIFQAVERRIWWGVPIGLGLLLCFPPAVMTWQAIVSLAASMLMIGFLIARLLGIALDGSVAKQWLNVVIEIVLLVPLFYWYVKASS
ncbi:hypothetical protein [Reinekea thalattae]|uniref:DUF4345 domain-containing protein n=1 Tax=Reinekea thalattae TaxID=2593301 RepID=A0A5C8ZAL7_9GAMM|nr:hypothetical protein [Reinekea thalattae]TXR53946.1 hypothetical protein FME95_05190 [Reinekea thalattae]